jgi:membrane protein YdbS with pleckstrin-like domain
MYYLLLIIGFALSFLGARWAIKRKINPEFMVRSKNMDNVLQIISVILFPGSYLIILFSHGFSVKWILINAAIVLVFHFIIIPILTAILTAITRRR